MISNSVIPRLEGLKSLQNADGGWSYRAGGKSWVEPTVYAALTLSLQSGYADCVGRARAFLESLQRADGAWPARPLVDQSHWSTALCVFAAARVGFARSSTAKGVQWLLAAAGSERGIRARFGQLLDPGAVDYDPSFYGWSWTAETTSWVEPTSYSILALKRAADAFDSPELQRRLRLGTSMLIERQCEGGGWNYGNRRVLGVSLPPYGRTTGLGLMALAGSGHDLQQALNVAGLLVGAPETSAEDKALLTLGLRANGKSAQYIAPEKFTDLISACVAVWAQTGEQFL